MNRHLEEAMDWLVRLQEAPPDGPLAREWEAWLAVDPDHRRAWDEARRVWGLLGEVAPAPAAIHRPVPRRRVKAAVLAMALAACLALLAVPSIVLRWQADQTTGTAELREVRLEDGSLVHLAPRSAFRAQFSPEARRVTLMSGEAFFQVARDPARPFIVEAEGLEAQVLGTGFDVRIASDALSVGVQSGAVAVRYGPAIKARLGPGDRLSVDRSTGRPRQDRLPPEEVASWRDGRLFVADATVAEVVEELRRFHPGWIVIADGRLAAARVTGLYDLRDPARALRALVRPAGGQLREVTPLLHILSMP
jgi:transmembrane sensor